MAALYVVLFHAIYFAHNLSVSRSLGAVLFFIGFGHYAVDVFIVLSGYCLMMPLAREGVSTIPGGIKRYLLRRGWRILPPYYTALVVSVLCVFVGQHLQRTGTVVGGMTDVLVPGIFLSHLFLIHNLNLDWVYGINAPMWSVATEWQIYFLFPLVLLPCYRRFGLFACVGLAFALGLAPLLLLPESHNFWWASPHFLGLFALGMAGAVLTFPIQATMQRWRNFWSAPATLMVLVVLVVGESISPKRLQGFVPMWFCDIVIGLLTMGLLIYCARLSMTRIPGSKRPLLLMIFEHRIATTLGAFSYSLYLIHHPLLKGIERLIHAHVHSTSRLIFIQIGIVFVVILPAAYLFYLLFEKPTIQWRKRMDARS